MISAKTCHRSNNKRSPEAGTLFKKAGVSMESERMNGILYMWVGWLRRKICFMIDVSEYTRRLELLRQWVCLEIDRHFDVLWTLGMFEETGYLINIRRSGPNTFDEFVKQNQ